MALLVGSIAAQEMRSLQSDYATNAVFDPQRQRVVLCGVGNYSREWDGSAWRQAPDLGSANGREYGAGVGGHAYWDTANSRLTVVNGINIHTRIGHRWQTQPAPGGPTNLYGAAYAYDSAQNRLLMFGGYEDFFLFVDQTWQFANGAWSQLRLGVRPTPRAGAAMAYDSLRQRVVLFGGAGNGPVLDDTWEWDGTTWAPIATPVRPTALIPGGMAYDVARQRMVLFLPVQPANSELWEYDGTTWLQRPVPPIAGEAPWLRVASSLVYDPARGEVLHAAADSWNDPWAYDGTSWSPRPGLPRTVLPVRDAGYAVDATGIHRFGGGLSPSGPTDELWRFTANGWQRLAVGGPTARNHASMWAQQGNLFVFGGEDGSGQLLADTWRWNGTAWSQVTSAASPSARSRSQVAYDPVSDRALLFSGFGAFADLWSFDGQQWQQVPAAGGPLNRWSHGLVHDLSRNRIVLSGGERIGGTFGSIYGLAETWEWNGSSWQQTVGGPAASVASNIAYDADSQQLLGYEGYLGDTGFSLFRYTGTSWVAHPVLGDLLSPQPLRVYLGNTLTGPGGRLTVVALGLVAELVQAPAAATDYGFACGAPSLQLTANGLPRLGDAAFALDLVGAPVSQAAVLGLADAPASVPIAGCALWIAPGFVSAVLATDAHGRAVQPLPLPTTASLLGANFFAQSLVLSSGSSAGFVLSPGLGLRLGQ